MKVIAKRSFEFVRVSSTIFLVGFVFSTCSNNKELKSSLLKRPASSSTVSKEKDANSQKSENSSSSDDALGNSTENQKKETVQNSNEPIVVPDPTGMTVPTASNPAVVAPVANTVSGTKVFTGPGMPPAGSKLSRAYAVDNHTFYANFPRKPGECSEEIHAQYWVKGVDGKIYPTWHPPIHPSTGCKFGHEHGADPSSSPMFATIGSPPFGFAQEQYEPNDASKQRSQPHVGYKIELSNNFQAKDNLPNIKCSVMNMFHHETFSTDGLVNPMHEFFYDAKCSDGLEIHWKVLKNMGKAGEFHGRCNGASSGIISLKNPVLNPMNPPLGEDSTLGSRSINDWHECIKPKVIDKDLGWAISERWIFESNIQHSSGLDVGFAITDAPTNPGRFGNKDLASGMQYMIDLCKHKPNWDECKLVNEKKLAWDDVGNPWNGEGRFTRPMWILHLQNKTGKTKWYTDVFGKNPSPTPFAGSIEQYFSLANEKIDGYYSPDTWRYVDPKNGIRLPN